MNLDQELRSLVNRAAQFQTSLGLENADFSRQYADFVGSPSTWGRLRNGNLGELNPSTWVANLRRLMHIIDGNRSTAEIFERLPIVVHARDLYNRTKGETGDRRIGWIVAGHGCGKSFAFEHLLRQAKRTGADDVFYCSVNVLMSQHEKLFLRDVALAIGCPSAGSTVDIYDAVRARLKARPVTLCLDEFHDGGMLAIKYAKALINETSVRLLITSLPTVWTRLNDQRTEGYFEAAQILRRCQRPVLNWWLNGVDRDDVLAFGRAIGIPLSEHLTPDLLAQIRRHGNLSLLADAYRCAKQISENTRLDCDVNLFKQQLAQLIVGRQRNEVATSEPTE